MDFGLGGGAGAALAANVVLRVAGQAAGLALTRRLVALSATGGFGPNEVGFIGGLADAMELVVALPAGALSDRWGRRPLLVAGAAVGALGLLIAGMAAALPPLAVGRALQGIGTGMTIPPLLGWFSDVTSARGAGGRARVMSGVGAGTAAGLLFGTVLGSVLWTRLGEAAFPALAALFFLATAFMARAPGRGGRRVVKGAADDLRSVLRTPGLMRLLAAWMLLNGVVGLWLTHAVYQLDAPVQREGQFLVGRFHGGTLDAVLGAWMALYIAGSLLWAPVLPRVGEWRGMQLALVGMLLVCLSLVALNARGLAEAWRWAALVPFCVGVVIEAGFAPAALSQLALGSEAAHRGLTMALYSVAFGTGSLLGNWAGAPFVSWGAMNGIIAATAIMASLALVALTLGYGAARTGKGAVNG